MVILNSNAPHLNLVSQSIIWFIFIADIIREQEHELTNHRSPFILLIMYFLDILYAKKQNKKKHI